MKFQPEELDRLSYKILQSWKDDASIQLKQSDSAILQNIHDAFQKEFELEAKLDAAVEKMLSQYEKQFDKGNLDRRKMFQMVRVQIAKEMKVIL